MPLQENEPCPDARTLPLYVLDPAPGRVVLPILNPTLCFTDHPEVQLIYYGFLLQLCVVDSASLCLFANKV